MAEINPTLSVVAFNVNGLTTNEKAEIAIRFRKQKHDSNIPKSTRDTFIYRHKRVKTEYRGKIYCANRTPSGA